MDEYRLSVAFCAVDESDLLEKAFYKISHYAQADEYIFVLSKKHSSLCNKTVKKICAQNASCRRVIQSGQGLGNAIKTCIAQAHGTHLIIWPADDGVDTNAFPKMLALSRQNPDAIIKVSRWLKKGSFVGYNKLRLSVNYLSQKAFASLYHSSLTDFTNPTQIAPLAVYRSITFEYDNAALIPEMVFKPLKNSVRFIEVPCKDISKRTSASHVKFLELVQYYFVILKILIAN